MLLVFSGSCQHHDYKYYRCEHGDVELKVQTLAEVIVMCCRKDLKLGPGGARGPRNLHRLFLA